MPPKPSKPIDNRLKTARAKPKAIWYAWFPGDYAAKTATLTLVEHGAYRVLLDHYYEMNGSMVANATLLLRVCRAFDPTEQAAVASVLAQYFVERDGYYHHERADAELAKRALLREKRAAAGSKGGKQKVANATNLLDVCQDVCNPQQQPQHTKEEELEPPLTGSNHETQNLVEPLLVCEERKPLPTIIPPKPISSKRTGTRWPAGQEVPAEWITAAATNRAKRGLPQIDLVLEAEKFTNYWTAKSGQSATKVDWSAAWRMWSLNAYGANSNGRSNGNAGQSRSVVFDDAIEAYNSARAEREFARH